MEDGDLPEARMNRPRGRVYRTIERAIYAFAPVLMLLFFLSYRSIATARQQLETNLAAEVAAETAEYCSKWGMPTGTEKYALCAGDLAEIRARAEKRYRHLTAGDFDF